MKYFLVISLFIIWPSIQAQKFIATPDGLRDLENPENPYLVLNVEGKDANYLYSKAQEYIIKNYKNPDEVMKGKLEGDYLRFDTFVPQLLFIKNGGIKQFFSATYSTELRFKNGKVRLEIISLEIKHDETEAELYFSAGGINWYLFNKKGILKKPETKLEIENYFNSSIKSIFDFISGNTKEKDW